MHAPTIATAAPRRLKVILAMGFAQILAWGSSFYLPAVLAAPIAAATGWSLSLVVGGLSLGLLVSGLVSPRVGAWIEARGGRGVLALSAALLAAGLVLMGLARDPAMFLAAWLVLGLGMGAGLYDPAFATLGRLYGAEARVAITSLTLVAGFASTLCWPLSAWLLARLGWRGAAFGYAALDLCVALPLYWFALPREAPRHPPPRAHRRAAPRLPGRTVLLVVVAFGLTLASVIAAVMSVYLLVILHARGMDEAAAVGIGTLVGPCQVGARLLDLLLGRRLHPVWATLLSCVLVAAGFVLALIGGTAVLIGGVICYGLGIGLRSIVRGTLPLALFGAEGYAVLIGRLAFPALIAQAAAPSAGAVLLAHGGSGAMLWVLLGAAVVNIAVTLAIWPLMRRTAPPAA